MKRSFRMLRWLVIVLAAGFIIIQFYRMPKTNPAVNPTQTIESHLQVSPQVEAILDRSCNDCHSNKTRWPWYSNVAPASWLVISDVNDGRSAMNLSAWGGYDKDKQSHRLRDMCEQVQDGDMPLNIYTPLHPSAKLSAEDKKTLCDWANSERVRVSAL